MRNFSEDEVRSVRLHLKSLLPKEAFEPDPTKLLRAAVHIAVALGCFALIGRTSSRWIWAACAIVAGHSLAVVSFYGHHLSHGAFVRQRQVLAVCEYVIWTITATPRTIWRKIHNAVHHRNNGALTDAIRYYAESERTWWRTVYSFLFIPNRYNWFNPLIFLTPMVLHLLHGFAAVFAPRSRKRLLVTNLGEYSLGERLLIIVEAGAIVGFQQVVLRLCGGTVEQYLWAGLASTVAGTLIAGTYVYSQHSVHPLVSEDAPFASTTLKLPSWVDRMHLHLAHHTAHHLFEGLNPDYLKQVTDLLRQHYPEALHEMKPVECWLRIFQNRMYKADPPLSSPVPAPGR